MNNSVRTHPMHLHGCRFRVISEGGKPPHPADRGVEGHGRGAARARRSSCGPYFDGFAGRYVFHCHNSEHGDQAMMGNMEVVA